ncbi:hypothetical protein BRYFOR_09746 [Marvinbryantia formatexigens DSM 14469]|uniref:Uncharacterized protein n=1 Tax=Marvinbryantia formatexigens DSM 14469 TaxID=478749 RepID=C6LM47_9FIRM|nr:hypothetical protein BRYFOR_09746 [Marvinbryantia formatexigens DSM 14469]
MNVTVPPQSACMAPLISHGALPVNVTVPPQNACMAQQRDGYADISSNGFPAA